MNKRPLWQIVWLISFLGLIIYYVIKTLVMGIPSTMTDTVIMVYSTVSLVVYVYFFHEQKDKKSK